MAEATVVLINPLGLHARAAAKIVKIAHESSVEVIIDRPRTNRSADARSILDLLELGAKHGTTLVIRTDNANVLREVVDLINDGFGEIQEEYDEKGRIAGNSTGLRGR